MIHGLGEPAVTTRDGHHLRRSRRSAGTVLMLGNHLSSLAAARSLAAAGYHVIAGDGSEYSTVDRSRFCHEVWPHPPIEQVDRFLGALSRFLAKRPQISLVLPLRSTYLKVFAQHQDRLPPGPVIAMPQPEVVLACLDKVRTYDIARDVGVPHHRIRLVRDLPELTAAVQDIGYPCVIRPTSDTGAAMPDDRKAAVVHDPAMHERMFARWPSHLSGLLVQRYSPGHRHNVYFVASAGRIEGRVQTRILRTDRIDGTGLAVEGLTVAPDPLLDRYCEALIQRLGYTGVGLAQFIVPADGGPLFLELNPRHAGSNVVAEASGLPLILAACRLAEQGEWQMDPDFQYVTGMRYVWTSRDLYGLGMAAMRGEVDRRAGLRWMRAAARAAVSADLHMTWSWRDPLPTLMVYMHLASRAPWRRAKS